MVANEDGVRGRLAISNTSPTKSFSVGDKLFIDETNTIVFDLKDRGRASRFFVDDQLAIGTTNPTKTFQVVHPTTGNTIVNIDATGRDLMTVAGNLVATNVILQHNLSTPGANLVMRGTASNVISVVGGTKTTNLYVTSNAYIGNAISLSSYGSNVLRITGNTFQNGSFTITGNVIVTGNLTVTDTSTSISAQELRVSNAVIHAGYGNNDLGAETGFIMTPGTPYSNVAMAFVNGDRGREMAFFHTDSYAGDGISEIGINTTAAVNVHVYGDIYTSNNIGAGNINPIYDLCVGSNVFFEDTGSNVMHASGNVFVNKLSIGSGGITVGNILTLNPEADAPVVIGSNVQMNAFRTTGTAPSGVSNTAPTDTFVIGDKIIANLDAINTLTVLGNTYTTNLVTESIFSSSNLIIHGDRLGGDSTSNVLIVKAGPTTSNTSAIEVYGASTSNTHQNIRFKTKNTERLRINSDGNIGISTTNPTQRLTVAGNVFVIGSNASVYGNTWGSSGNISMRVYSTSATGENKIENIVSSGKGLNFYASTTPTMGTPKLTLLESSNVGINTQSPFGRLHTSGGTVFINDRVVYSNGYSHLGSPLVVTNTSPIQSTADVGTVLHLTREGTTSEHHGARATFKLGKHIIEAGQSNSRLDICIANVDYKEDTTIMTLLSNGKVGIGHTQPDAHLEIACEGIADPTGNGLLVHNHDGGDAIITAQTGVSSGNAFSSYIQTNGSVLSGWTTGISGTNGDFRITNDHEKVSSSTEVAVFIDGSTHFVGIGTDNPREALEVNGNLVIGNQLSFGGLPGSQEYGNTYIIERRYNQLYPAKTELLIFKGSDSTASADTGPDRVRYIAGEHVFQTYTSVGEQLYGETAILADMDGLLNKPLVVCDNQIVVVGGTRNNAQDRGVNTKLVVNGDIEFDGGGSFKLSGLEFSSPEGYNIIRNVLATGGVRRPLTLVHEVTSEIDFEFARFDAGGNLGLGTASPSSNLHIFNSSTGSQNILRLESPGTNKETGMLIYTNIGEGGYIKGFSNSTNSTTGLVMGVATSNILTNCIHLIQSSNVGIGTSKPATKLHVYNGVPRIQSSTSNAIVELTTTAGTANIYLDRTGNVFITPVTVANKTCIKSDLEILGDLAVDGAIDLGNQVAIGLEGATANTSLHVNGGIITNSDQVSKKTYSKTFAVGQGSAYDVQLMFGTGAFYAKITAMLRRTDSSTVADVSTMILEVQGGTGDGTASTVDVAVGTNNIFGGTNPYPWDPTVTTGTKGISIKPYNIDGTREYSYDILVELVSACNGKLEKITRDATPADLDDVGGSQTVATFTY
jgi:hypothetical protein